MKITKINGKQMIFTEKIGSIVTYFRAVVEVFHRKTGICIHNDKIRAKG